MLAERSGDSAGITRALPALHPERVKSKVPAEEMSVQADEAEQQREASSVERNAPTSDGAADLQSMLS
jgi:hypothetical protein